MAMAAVANKLALRGLKVLAIDFDLEAPGLERYFFDDDQFLEGIEGAKMALLISCATTNAH